jgi:NSS family neurotransmitter:Na+ symporter
MSIFVGWVWGAHRAADEIAQGSGFFANTRGVWVFMIRFFIPLVIFLILLNLFGAFD